MTDERLASALLMLTELMRRVTAVLYIRSTRLLSVVSRLTGPWGRLIEQDEVLLRLLDGWAELLLRGLCRQAGRTGGKPW